tara:strand:+ start:533 stop:1081 length:549 start_codon:yes stop_codon:yes gene_type:complete
MKKFLLTFLLVFLTTNSFASTKSKIIKNLDKIENLSFNFEQNINNKKENGNCIVKYPKKIYCKYNSENKKILVSNGKSLVIKTLSSYYMYPLEKTPLNLILDKKFLLKKIKKANEFFIDEKLVSFKFTENDNEINIFFNKDNYNLIGWQTIDIYQNLSMTYLSSLVINQKIKSKLFNLPNPN